MTVVYFFGLKKQFYIKRFIPELKTKKVHFIDQSKDSYLELVSSNKTCNLELEFIKPRNKNARPNLIIDVVKFINIKGVNALGNKLSNHSIKNISLIKSNYSNEILKEENKENTNSEKKDITDNTLDDNQIKIDF